MADNVTLNPGIGGAVVAADEINGAQFQRIKLVHGADGINAGDVSVGNPLPVAGNFTATLSITQPLTDTQLRATPVPVSLGSTTITGSVAVTGSFYQATQPVSIATAPVLVAGSAIIGKVGIDQTTPGTTNGVQITNSSVAVTIASMPSTPVTGTFWQATQPVSGTVAISNSTIEISNDVGNPVPISGTVTANTGLTQPLTDTQLRATPVPVSGIITATVPSPIPTYPFEFWIRDTGYVGPLGGSTGRIYNLFGYRNQWNSITDPGDLCGYLAGGVDQQRYPTVGTTYYVVSASTQDSAAGTGCDSVRITYLDGTGLLQLMTVTLQGTTPVSIGNNISYIEWMAAEHSTIFNRVPVGSISITSTNGAATESTTIEQIVVDVGNNTSVSLKFKVPSNKHAYILDFQAEASGTNFVVQLLTTTHRYDDTISNTYQMMTVHALKDGAVISEDMRYKKIPANAYIKVSAIPAAKGQGNKLTASIHLLLEDSAT